MYLLPVVDGVESEDFGDILAWLLNEDLAGVLEHFDRANQKESPLTTLNLK